MSSKIHTPFAHYELLPQEEKLEFSSQKKQISIGIPKETCLNEKRICLTPDACQVLTENGFEVHIESGAGLASYFTDLQFSQAGARITQNASDVYNKHIVLKINPPTPEEIDFLEPNCFLISALQINLQSTSYFKQLASKKINAIGFEFISDQYNQLSLVRLIGEIAGNISILVAADLLCKYNGLFLGGITGVRPTEVVVLGAGIVGEYATKTALGLGANVKVFDNSLEKLRRMHAIIDNRVPTSIIDPKELSKSLKRADVVIGAMGRNNLNKPTVTEDMVKNMKPGSVIIDVAIDNGGCVETSELTSHDEPYIIKHEVIHCGLANITSRYPRTATKAISNFFLSYLLDIEHENGIENILLQRGEIKNSFYMYKGRHTNPKICKKFNLTYHDINLLLF